MARELDINIKVENGEAVQKLHETDVAVDQVGTTSLKTSQSVDTASKSWDTYTVSAKEAADVLGGRGGIRDGLNSIADAAGFTVEKLGLLSSAGLAVGVGYEAWKIGRAIADFFELDTKIANATATLMGWGDLAAETAGAKADVLAKATAAAGREITDMKEAMAVNQKVADEWSDHLTRLEGPKQATLQAERFNQELDKLKKDGVLSALTRDIEAHSGSQQELAKWYGVSTGAIQFYTKELATAAGEEKAYKTEQEARWKAEDKALREAAKLQEQIADIEYKQRLQVNKQITAELEKQVAAMAKEQAMATAAELSAKEKVMAGYGLTVTGAPIEMLRDPLVKVTKALEDLERTSVAGVSQESQKQLLYDQFIKEQQQGLPVLSAATSAAAQAAQGHLQVASAAGQAVGAFSGFSTMMFSLMASPHQLVPGGGGGGQWTNPYGAGAIGGSAPIQVGPFGSNGSQSSNVTVNVAGNVNSDATARLLADQVAAKVLDRLKQNSRITYSKA